MKTSLLKLVLALITTISVFSSCKKDETRPNPTMSFITDEGYTSANATVLAGDTVQVGFICTWNGTDLLTSMNVYVNDQLNSTFTFTPAGENGTISITIPKSGAASEIWTFELVDANGQKNSLSLTFTKETSGGDLEIYTGTTIGTQSNTTDGSFYSFSNNTAYSQTEAETNQGIIDLLGAYSLCNGTQLTSPGANLTGLYDLSSWTTKNTTYYCKMNISGDQFDFIDSDKYIIDSYDGFESNDRKRKAKYLQFNDIYVFKTESGKYGILKITSVTAGENGKLICDVKIQQ